MNLVTIKMMREVLITLIKQTKVVKLEVFGSVARCGRGNDLDLIVVVDPIVYVSFVSHMLYNWFDNGGSLEGYYESYREQRMYAMFATLGMSAEEIAELRIDISEIGGEHLIDFHVMPTGWHTRVDEIQAHLPHDDSEFVRKIALDARRLRIK